LRNSQKDYDQAGYTTTVTLGMIFTTLVSHHWGTPHVYAVIGEPSTVQTRQNIKIWRESEPLGGLRTKLYVQFGSTYCQYREKLWPNQL
jgi:hypothetical protein